MLNFDLLLGVLTATVICAGLVLFAAIFHGMLTDEGCSPGCARFLTMIAVAAIVVGVIALLTTR